MDNKNSEQNLQALWSTSGLAGASSSYLEALYEDYLNDPGSVSQEWREYFASMLNGSGPATESRHSEVREVFKQLSRHKGQIVQVPSEDLEHYKKQVSVQNLIHAYRFGGHQRASFNPLFKHEEAHVPSLELQQYGLSEADFNTEFLTNDFYGLEKASLAEIVAALEQTYCGNIGVEFTHCTTMAERAYIREHLEREKGCPDYPVDVKEHLLQKLIAAEGLERFLHSKYVGQKRFSLEGADSLIPCLDECVQHAGNMGVKEVVIGMAHRGRLNVLVNIMGKKPDDLFQEFEGKVTSDGKENTGDVKYHMGFSSNVKTLNGMVHVALAFNPSHLEIVGPVVEGSVRARQTRRVDKHGDQVVPIIVHGDAAFAGQGVVMETLNMSQSRGYSTKGTIHIVVNNQIGFTTSNQQDARSTLYCTDVAKMVNAPIFHVNGDDPEAVLFVTRLAIDYRMKFHKDVIIDIVCYRRHGHSEADEPQATQPMMYKNIKAKQSPRALYAAHLISKGVVSSDKEKQINSDYRAKLETGQSVLANQLTDDEAKYTYKKDWDPYLEKLCFIDLNTTVPQDKLIDLCQQATAVPEDFKLHFSVQKIYDNRRAMAAGEMPMDWGCAEMLAYASLVNEKFHVRISGQDCGRGTFFHRHALILDQNTGENHVPLRDLKGHEDKFLVINSLLSEEAVLAFEYGYATTDPNTLTVWEAQFGDFANGAQVVIDQFISAGEQKWNRLCGLVMLLPHGFEGQGPEHSSARLERYLQLCAQNNMQVCVPTTPAQIFHLLRRQMMQSCRKPLIVFSPKSLLRHKLAVSDIKDLTEGTFLPIIPEIDELDDDKVKRVVMCHGRVYYDLLQKRREFKRNDVAIIRMEQLYPFPKAQMKAQLERYKNASEFYWCQEEPKNQGSWFTSQHHVRSLLTPPHYLEYAGRPFSAAPAVGYSQLHAEQLEKLLHDALGEPRAE
ncbi:MAG: 2-oxoglutarate dehydrogenase E1 component [Gammaproteobacteria bacterium]|nr:2-oxoglutarate dehydrogenase E1 component [Gammaproteobacteria bacterium]